MAGKAHINEDRILRTIMVLRSSDQSLDHSRYLHTRHTFLEVADTDEIGSARRSQSCSSTLMFREPNFSLDEPKLVPMISRDIMPKHDGQKAQLNAEVASNNLYVSNLTSDWTKELLSSEFQRFGTVMSVKILTHRTERKRLRRTACGFVQFSSNQEAERAKVKLDGKEFFGRCIRIQWGKPFHPTLRRKSCHTMQGAKEVKKAGGGSDADSLSEEGLSSQSTAPSSPNVHRTPLARMGSRYKRRIRMLRMRGEQ